jgi:NADH:ubiquinone oxidoreductase subunit 3 (subunit A)
MDNIVLSPPVAFLIILALGFLLGQIFFVSTVWKKKGAKIEEGTGKAYECGEEGAKHLIQPDYSQFFPFAFFFTILHIIALMATTVPVVTLGSFTITIFYLVGAVTCLSVFLRGVRNK